MCNAVVLAMAWSYVKMSMFGTNLGVRRNIQRLQSGRITKSPLLLSPKDFFRFARATT